MASALPMHLMWGIPIEFLHKPNINEIKLLPISALDKPTWMDDVIASLLHDDLLEDKAKARKLTNRVANYIMIGDNYIRGTIPYLTYDAWTRMNHNMCCKKFIKVFMPTMLLMDLSLTTLFNKATTGQALGKRNRICERI